MDTASGENACGAFSEHSASVRKCCRVHPRAAGAGARPGVRGHAAPSWQAAVEGRADVGQAALGEVSAQLAHACRWTRPIARVEPRGASKHGSVAVGKQRRLRGHDDVALAGGGDRRARIARHCRAHPFPRPRSPRGGTQRHAATSACTPPVCTGQPIPVPRSWGSPKTRRRSTDELLPSMARLRFGRRQRRAE